MRAVIIIPARYGSSRFPGKPLAKIAGKTMLQRVCEIALEASKKIAGHVEVFVTTDDERISDHAQALGIPAILTPAECQTGTDRVVAAVEQLSPSPDFILNLQGDTPLIPAHFVSTVMNVLISEESVQWVTPVTQLTWSELDQLRAHKKITPFSGTTAIVNEQEQAIWFSKNIIPAIRGEAELRKNGADSPIFRHIGIYGCPLAMLRIYNHLEQTPYEILEGLEQLRLLEHGYPIRVVKVNYGNHPTLSGVDTPEDAKRAEALIKKWGLA